MPCEIRYLVEQRVIVTRLYGRLSHEDSEQFNRQNIDLIRCGDGQVHIIFEIEDLQHIELNVRQMLSLMSFTREPGLGWVVIVGGNQFAKFLGTLVLQAGSVNHRFVRNSQEAFDLLKHLEPDLDFVLP